MSTFDPEFVAAQTTVDTRQLAEQLASAVVESRLAACVQISEVASIYRWDGAVEKDTEQLLTFKTTSQALSALSELIEREHPYDEPEFVVLPITGGSASYLTWIRESVQAPADDR